MRRRTYAPAPRRRSRARAGIAASKEPIAITLGAAAYGYLSEHVDSFSALETKLPKIGNKELTTGAALYFANKYLIKNRHVRTLAIGALAVGGYKLGQNKFSMQGDDSIGWSDAVEIDGSLEDYMTEE